MFDSKNFRIIVDLSGFFYDHRRVARIFIKSNIKTVEDLQNRITEIFGIKEFHLTTGAHFLPAVEDIRVLHHDETVIVIPNKAQEVPKKVPHLSTVNVSSTSEQGKKRSLEVITEESDELASPKKKKNKKKHYYNEEAPSSEEETFYKKKDRNSRYAVEEELVRKKKKKTKEKLEELEETLPSKNKKSKKKRDYNKESFGSDEQTPCKTKCIDESVEKMETVKEIKMRLKQKTEEQIQKHSESIENKELPKLKNILPVLQSHIKSCNDSGRSNVPDMVRLSRHVDTPVKTFTKYIPPIRNTDQYLAKTKVNIVKIDVIKKSDAEVETASKILEETEICTPPKDLVKNMVVSFEKKISPTGQSSSEINEDMSKNDKVNEDISKELQNKCEESVNVEGKYKNLAEQASNYTKAFLDKREENGIKDNENKDEQSDMNSLENSVKMEKIFNSNIQTTCSNVAPENDTSTPYKCVLTEKKTPIKPASDQFQSETPALSILNPAIESTEISLDISSIPQESASLNESSDVLSSDTFLKPNSSEKRFSLSQKRRYSGVGSLITSLKESDSAVSQESDATQFVTKRRRIRKRQRKRKKSVQNQTSDVLSSVQPYVPKPMNVKACPIIHIKFDDHDDDSVETPKENDQKDVKDSMELADRKDNAERKESSPELTLSDTDQDSISQHEVLFSEDAILKSPLMGDKLQPKQGDVIAFKLLRLNDNYAPEISSYIVGKVENYWSENKTVDFKILSGIDQCLRPSEKLFSSIEEDEDKECGKLKKGQNREYLWSQLLYPRLIFP